MNETQLLISALIGIILGVLHEGVAEGVVLESYKWPAKLTPYATIAMAFGGAFVASMGKTPTASYSSDAIQGLLAIGGLFGTASAIRTGHFATKAQRAAIRVKLIWLSGKAQGNGTTPPANDADKKVS